MVVLAPRKSGTPTLAAIRQALREFRNPARAAVCQRFFKTGPGGYGEGDRFIGATVPEIRSLVRCFHPQEFAVVARLIQSRIHEERLLGLLLLVERYRAGAARARGLAYRLYLRSLPHINNWDLVDATAEHVVGPHGVGRARLLSWAASRNLWLRRIAVVSTMYAIRRNRFGETLALARRLLGDPEDLIHKAVGWMLREVGKRDRAALEGFLGRYSDRMPRTMLRYAIERFPEAERRRYLTGPVRRPPARA